MKIAFFDTHSYERPFFENENGEYHHQINFLETRLSLSSVKIAEGYPCVCCFVNDHLDRKVLEELAKGGTQLIVLRSAGFNHVDTRAAKELGLTVLRVPEYSPYAVAEYAVALILNLNRKIHRAYTRVRDANFSLEGLLGFDLNGKTVGVVGTGKIGVVFAKIMKGFGCRVLAYDLIKNETLRDVVEYLSLEELLRQSDILSLHIPLTLETRHIVDKKAFGLMKTGAMLINTGRGALIDTSALLLSLKSGKLGSAGLDVYEEEEGVFFEDLSEKILQDDVLARLLTFHNVLLTSHQAFFTREALQNISHTTLKNVTLWEKKEALSPGTCV